MSQFEFRMASSFVDGVILSVAAFRAERRISRYYTVCNGRSLGPLVRTRALRDDALQASEFKMTHYWVFAEEVPKKESTVTPPKFSAVQIL